jgi:hypothetical protein
MKKVYYIPLFILSFAIISFVFIRNKKKCAYPLFELNYQGQTVDACFQAADLIHHQHKDSVMIEVVNPAVMASGQLMNFESHRDLANFACQIILQSKDKKPTRSDFLPTSSLPTQPVIRVRDDSLFASEAKQSTIIERLFCMANI